MNQTFIRYAAVFALIGAAVVSVFLSYHTPQVLASSIPGIEASMATSTAYNLSANTVTSVAATSSCAARIVSSGASAINLQFGDQSGSTLTGSVFTATQNASTTVAYDSGQYGCGLVRAYAYAASKIIISETR